MKPTLSSPAIEVKTPLSFKPLEPEEIPAIAEMLAFAPDRTCDFTIGGLYMWTDFFRYRRAIIGGDTLFIEGVSENDVRTTAFSLPVGKMPLLSAIELLRCHCRARGIPLRLSAVPEPAVESLQALGASVVAELTDWADYLYDADMLATLTGKKMAKKRNHVNAFINENPGFCYEPISDQNLPEVTAFYSALELPPDKPLTAEVEREQTLRVLAAYGQFPFSGALLRTPEHGIVAFTIGEVRDDTLFVHIEKMRHDINGAGETINKLFAEEMRDRRCVRFINREEDTGDPGLRQAKLSYHPLRLIRKFDLVLPL